MTLEDHALSLLSYVSKNRDRPQSLGILEDAVGIPLESLRQILMEALEEQEHSTLSGVAYEYGFDYKIYRDWIGNKSPYPRRIIDVVKRNDRY